MDVRSRLAALAACALIGFFLSRIAFAVEPARVVILKSQSADPLIDEALIRARGELSGMGLETSVLTADDETLRRIPSFGSEVYGVVAFERYEQRVQIRAYSPGSQLPIVQDVDLQKTGVNAEVLAVRAVEALRAALLEYTRKAQAENRALPTAVTDFAEDRAPTAEPAPDPTAEPDPPPPPVVTPPKPVEPPKPPPAEPPPRRKQRPALRLWIGPDIPFDRDTSGRPGLGGEIGALLEPSWYVIGLSGSMTLLPLSAETQAGSATVQRRTALLHFGIRANLGRSVDLLTTAGGGFASYTVAGSANPGYHDQTAVHTSGAFSLGLAGSYWFVERFGAYLGLRLTSGTDAPVIRIDERDVITLERPTLSLSAGLTVGAF